MIVLFIINYYDNIDNIDNMHYVISSSTVLSRFERMWFVFKCIPLSTGHLHKTILYYIEFSTEWLGM